MNKTTYQITTVSQGYLLGTFQNVDELGTALAVADGLLDNADLTFPYADFAEVVETYVRTGLVIYLANQSGITAYCLRP